MANPVSLPPALRQQLKTLARRLRLFRGLRGVSLLILLMTLTGGLALLADFLLALPTGARQALFCAWVGIGAVTLLLAVLLPLIRSVRPAALAAAVEQQYPQLGERLTSTVELATGPDAPHGSPQLIAHLVRDTEQRTHPLDFRPVVTGKRAFLIAGLAAFVLTAAAAPALLYPDHFGHLALRFLYPWGDPAIEASYALEAGPGDLVAAKGRPVSLTLRVVPRFPRAGLPAEATLVTTDAGGQEQRLALGLDGQGNGALEYVVPGDVSYHFEAGPASSPTHTIEAVTPVDLAEESPEITVAPPAYAAATVPTETYQGLTDLAALRHGEVRFAFRFTRPAVAARLEWTTTELKEAKGETRTVSHTKTFPLALSEDRTAGTLTLPATQPGTYRIVLEAEHGITTERDGGTLTVRNDEAPVFLNFSGKEELKAILPYDRLPLEVRVADDVGVARLELEYRILREGSEPEASAIEPSEPEALATDKKADAPKVTRQPLTLTGVNRPEATGRGVLALAGKVRAGDRVLYRLRLLDNLPEKFGGPNRAFYPDDRWLSLEVARKGSPLKEQEILAQHDALRKKLEKIKENLKREQRGVYKVRQDSRRDPALSGEQREALTDLRQQNRATEGALREIARDFGAVPALGKVADLAHDLAEKEMRQASQALQQAGADKARPPQRDQEFRKADEQLSSALKRLDDLQALNEKLGKDRLDLARAQALADRQKHLAERAADLASRDPIRDPDAVRELQQLRREQNEVANQLDRLMRENDLVRRALDEARAEESRQLADQARQLAEAQRDLANAGKETDQQLQKERLAELAGAQQKLAEQAARLARETERSARAANADPLKDEAARQAAEALKKGDAEEAGKRQDQAAQDLERLALQLDQALQLGKDPREAARQLARLQKDLQERLRTEQARKDAAEPLPKRLEPLAREQEALRRATEGLSVPPTNEAAKRERARATDHSARAAEALKKDPARATQEMAQAREALDRLARALPDVKQRQRQALAGLRRLQREQERVSRLAQQGLREDKNARRRLEEGARRQAQVADALGKLDTPNEEAHRERAEQAVNRALRDLMDGRKQDIPASQEAARRQLSRLEQALRGGKPDDEKARELADEQRKLTEEAARLAADPKAAEEAKQLQRQQQELARKVKSLGAPEAPLAKAEAEEATRKAAEASQAQPTVPQTREQMAEAARKLEDLARQLAGQESPAEAAERLARKQAEAAARAEEHARRNPGRPLPAEARREQQALSREARQVRAPDAQTTKERAVEALRKAESANPRDQGKAAREAADALRDLADRLAGRQTPAEQATELARLQRKLADKPEPGQAARQQADLARRLSRLDPKGAPEEGKQAAEALAKAQQALQREETPRGAKEELDRAADSLERLAKKLRDRENPPDGATEAAALAREQKALAKEAADTEPGKPAPAEARKAEAKQGDLKKRLEGIRTEPATAAAQAQKETAEAMAKAREALSKAKTPADAREELAKAADAAEQLARQLAQERATRLARKSEKRDDSPQRLARRLADQQRSLARETEQADKGRAEAGPRERDQELQRLSRKQEDLNRQASRLPAEGNQTELQRARETMNRARDALDRQDVPEARRRQAEAADALERLARKLPEQAARPERAARAPERPSGLPQQGQSDRARQLARQQRELREAVRRALADNRGTEPGGENPAGELARRQEDLARRAGELARNVGREQGDKSPLTRQAQQAGEAARQAGRQAQAGALPQAQQSGEQAAEGLRKLAGQLARTPRPDNAPRGPDTLQKARRLGEEQEALNRQMRSLAGDPRAQRAQQAVRQADLRRQTGELTRELNRLAGEQNRSTPQGRRAAQQMRGAARSGQQAEGAMGQAQTQACRGNPSGVRQSQQQAARALEQAARQAGMAAGQQTAGRQGQPQPGATQAGQALQQARGQMTRAQGEMTRGQTQGAQSAMQQAAGSLGQAAQQLARQMQPGTPREMGRPGDRGAAGGGKIDENALKLDPMQYLGKRWGQLPGTLRTKLLQDMREKYGEDYARTIKLYFEGIADTKKK